MRRAFLIAGLPGAGKTTAAELCKDLTGGGILSAGDMIRELAAMDGLEDPSSLELGEYAAGLREEHGEAFFGEKAVGMLLRNELDSTYPLFIDGVRHRDSIVEFSEYFDSTVTIYLRASREERLARLQERGRDGEDGFTMVDLAKRDKRELEELGTQTILDSDRVDHFVTNEGDIRDLRYQLESIL